MSRIEATLIRNREQGRKSLIIYLTAGCPDYATTKEAVLAALAAGADVVELGLPFSDPMADGPVLQTAGNLALANGATTRKSLDLVKSLRQETDAPLLTMCYLNTVLQYGIDEFTGQFSAAGLDGLIIPDMPDEEAQLLAEPCQQNQLDIISFLATTTGPKRAQRICRAASGFIYCIAVNGVTGVQKTDYQPISGIITEARCHTDLPLAIGFGIGSGAAAQEAARHSDAVIVGSALMQQLMEHGVGGVTRLVGEIRQALDQKEAF
ncbi:tryptophan synthase subunit alpha [Azotosporobacter soli]|uniref:tryptophan synthase subunit alpha n=1 Tax=Azotosporobacter soli TaxID=3055040 RepID=UPI0031FE99D6